MQESIFAVYKPRGISSYDVIRKLKQTYPNKKIGHGGTLDPLAEGVLVIGVGKQATKQLHHILHDVTKTYTAEIMLGKTSPTDDAEGPITTYASEIIPEYSDVEFVLKKFVGEIQQVPPHFSAVKVNGQPAYKLARKGIPFELKPKTVHIYSIKIISYSYPLLKLQVEVGSGTYIRSLARDIGKALGTGGYIHNLMRNAVGEFTLENVIKL